MTSEGVQPAGFGLDSRVSQDTYGSGPQSFPYTSFFPEPYYGAGGGGGGASYVNRRHSMENLGYEPSVAHDSVRIKGGEVYCGGTRVSVHGPKTFSSGSVWLNIRAIRGGSWDAQIEASEGGDLSIKLYDIDDYVLHDYVSGTMFIPYYN